MSGQGVRTHPPMVLLAMAQEIKLSAFFRDRKLTFLLVVAGPSSPYWRLSEIMGSDLPSFLSFRSAGSGTWAVATWCAEAKKKKSIYDEPPSLGFPRQRVFSITAWLGGSRVSASNSRVVTVTASRTLSPFFQFMLGFLLPPTPFLGYRSFFGVEPRVRMGMLVMLGSVSTTLLKMPVKNDVTSSSAAEQNGKGASGEVHAEKFVDKLNVRELCERFCIPNGVSVQLVDREAVSTEKSADNAIYFTNEQFNVGLRFPLPSLFKEFLHFTQIPPAYIHSNMVRVLMGCSILSMLFNLDLSLLEVLFIYSIKKGKNDVFSLAVGLPSLQLVTDLPDSTKGGAKGHVLVLGTDKKGRVVEWVEKTSFDRLNKLFEIIAAEMHHQTLLTARNLLVVEARKADARARRALLNEREERRQEGTLRRAPGDKHPAPFPPARAPTGKKKKVPTKGIVIRSPASFGLPSILSDSVRIPGQNGSGPSMPEAERLALLARVETSVDQPGSRHPDADVAGASCPDPLPLTAPPMEEMGAERQGLHPCESSSLTLVPLKRAAAGRSRPARDLKSGINGRLQDRLLKTIEVNCSSAKEGHPERSQTEIAEENLTVPVLVPNEGSPEEIQPVVNNGGPDPGEESRHNASSGGSPVDDAACTSASPFSYAELGEMLKQIPPGLDVALPSAKIFSAAGERYSRHGSTTRSFFRPATDYRSHEGLRLPAHERASEESVEALKRSQDDNEALWIELAEAKRREEAIKARLHEAEDEMAQLRGQVRQLWTEVSIEKKQKEDLQLRLSAQKEELETEFAAQREELKTEYQKQVDEMYFFGYCCCMKKHGIKRDVPSIPPGEEEKLRRKPSQ
ncbi:hypothetical protein CK203_000999 [Vitis vinifera]|uniref:Uncharacterized protein n=1 Tax=Vitis vinifera TaxID=29760 RepID=A0A438KLX6_VITVI|nr:hypothetical protein CK203_000999 [Vitis vinifera]